MTSNEQYRQFKFSYTLIIFQMQSTDPEEQLPMNPTITCEICYCNFEQQGSTTQRPTGICYDCWYQHIKTFISQISYKTGSEVISPFQGRDPIDICLALKTLRPSDEVELQEFLFKKYSAFTADIEKCPSESCDFVFTLESCRWGKTDGQLCPKCSAVLTTAGGLDLKSIVGFVYFLFLTNKCPRCEIPIEKTTGCPHMSCPCGHQFCWYCLKDYYPAPNNVYSVHEPRECAAIFISKLAFTGICIAGIFLTLLGNDVFQRFVEYFFIGMRYLVHTLLLDAVIAINIFLINNLIVHHYNRPFYDYSKMKKFGVAGLVIFDLIVLAILYYLQLLVESGVIILVEVSLVGLIAATVWFVMINIDTWFKFIC